MKDATRSDIHSREDFRRVLAETLELVRRLATRTPGFPPYENIIQQLEAVSAWTASGKTPTQDQRSSIDVGLVAARELDEIPAPDVKDLANRIHAISYYFDNL